MLVERLTQPDISCRIFEVANRSRLFFSNVYHHNSAFVRSQMRKARNFFFFFNLEE
jgi:hypothetical protein